MTKNNIKPLPPRARLIELLDCNPRTGMLTWRVSRRSKAKKGTRAGCLKPFGYRQVTIDGVLYQEHRIIFRICTGIDAGDFEVDHKNRVRDDNRISNLRLATSSQQNTNQEGIAGCTFSKVRGKWQATIRIDGVSTNLGYWPTQEIAQAVYATAAKEIHGEFAPDPPPNPFGFDNQFWGNISDGSTKGVYFDKAAGKWRASITIDGKRTALGLFPTQDEARQARLAAEGEQSAAA